MPRKKLTQEQIDDLTRQMLQIHKDIRDHEAAAITARDHSRKIQQTLRTAALQLIKQQTGQ